MKADCFICSIRVRILTHHCIDHILSKHQSHGVRPSVRRGPLQTSFNSSVHFGRCVRRWLVRPILVRKVLSQLGQGRLSPGSSVLALSFLVSLFSSATRVRLSSQFTAPLCMRERQPGLSVAASSQVSGFILNASERGKQGDDLPAFNEEHIYRRNSST